MGRRRYRIASQSVWDPVRQRPFARQAVLGPADPPPVADLSAVGTVGTSRVGDVGALVWIAEQLDLVKLIDQACALSAPTEGPTIGEMVLAVAVQRACAPAAKRICTFLEAAVPRVSCLPAAAFTVGFSSMGGSVTDEHGEGSERDARAAYGAPVVHVVLASTPPTLTPHCLYHRRRAAREARQEQRRGGGCRGRMLLWSRYGALPLLHRTTPPPIGPGGARFLSRCLVNFTCLTMPNSAPSHAVRWRS